MFICSLFGFVSQSIHITVDRSGQVYITVDRSGQVYITVDRSGQVYITVDRSGQVYITSNLFPVSPSLYFGRILGLFLGAKYNITITSRHFGSNGNLWTGLSVHIIFCGRHPGP